MKPEKKHIIWIIFICGCIFFPHLDVLEVNIMEARNFITAREALTLDHWVFTTANDLPRYEKPPLPTWITAFFGSLFGIHSSTFLRLPAAIFATILIISLYRFVAKLAHNTLVAFITSLVAATSYLIIFTARNGQWDIYTHAFMMISISFLYSFFQKEKTAYGIVVLAALFFGFSFMSKGPVSAYGLWLPFIISYGIVYRFNLTKRKAMAIFLFLIIALVISGWWYMITYLNDETLSTIAQHEIQKWNTSKTKPFYYYFDFVIHNGTWTIPAIIAMLYPFFKNKVSNPQAYRFSTLWTLISIILLSIIPGKKSRYLVPVMLPLAINIGFYLEYVFINYKKVIQSKKSLKTTWDIQAAKIYFIMVGIICSTFCVSGFIFFKSVRSFQLLWLIGLAVTLLMIGIYILRSLYLQNIQDCFYGVIACVMATILLGMPLTKTFKTNPNYTSFATLKDWELKNSIKVYDFIDYTPEIVWSYKGILTEIEQEGTMVVPEYITFGVLVTEKDTPRFYETFKNDHIEKVTTYDLNIKPKDHKAHKNRLHRTLYKITTSN